MSSALTVVAAGGQIPAWPFVALSFGVGVFALGPYFALWTPSKEAVAPPSKEEIQGFSRLGLKGTESKIGAWLLLAGAVATVMQVLLKTAMKYIDHRESVVLRIVDGCSFLNARGCIPQALGLL